MDNPAQMNLLHSKLTNKDRRFPAAIFVGRAALITILIAVLFFGGYKLWKERFGQTPVPAPEKLASHESPTAEPVRLNIPSLRISAPFVKLALNPDRTLEVPKGDREVGWFIYGAKPGDAGPSVVVGHKDSTKGPAVFGKLSEIKKDDQVKITRADGSEVTYVIESVSKYSQDNFPTNEVYGELDYAGLRLITCAGVYSKDQGRYSENFIAFGRLKQP